MVTFHKILLRKSTLIRGSVGGKKVRILVCDKSPTMLLPPSQNRKIASTSAHKFSRKIFKSFCARNTTKYFKLTALLLVSLESTELWNKKPCLYYTHSPPTV